jgi:SAM-dependent methyltransferase
MEIPENWYETWFNSPYYHTLYKNRDLDEARLFIDNMLSRLNVSPGAHFLDLACGKGRHSLQISSKGYKVTGVDLSPENIKYARSTAGLQGPEFYVKDMRDDMGLEVFDVVVNMFTSFGYFNSDEENFKVFGNVARSIKPGGYFVFDYLNCDYVLHKLTPAKDFLIDGLHFQTRKFLHDKHIVKEIIIDDGAKYHHFYEKVRLFTYRDLYQALLNAGFGELESFGNYHLEPFHIMDSPRLIFIGQKMQ